jgi:signal transduction histidine kinase/DNA-binding response OmpR family regulator
MPRRVRGFGGTPAALLLVTAMALLPITDRVATGYEVGEFVAAGTLVALIALPRLRNRAKARRTQLRLQRETERSAAILRAVTNDALIATDLTGSITHFGVGAERLLGYACADILGRRADQVLQFAPETQPGQPSSDRDGFWTLAASAERGDGDLPEWTAVTADQRQVRVHITATGVYGLDGRPEGYLLLARDRTDEFERSEHIQRQELALSEAQQIAKMGSWNLDLRTGSLECSNELRRIYGFDSTGTGSSGVLGPDDFSERVTSGVAMMRRRLVELESGAQRREWDLRIEVDGEPRFLHTEAVTSFDAQGRAVTVSGTTQDVTGLRTTERQLRAREAELIREHARAEQALESRSAFLATMSHEIRTPINAVIGMTSLLLTTSMSDQQRDYVETVRTSGDALLSLVNDILDFSKIESGKLTVEKAPFSVHDLVDRALQLVSGAAAAKKLELILDLDPGMPQMIIGDVTRLRQVLLNLLSNAVKFTETGEVRLQASVVDAKTMVFRIHDTGPGISLDQVDRLFEAFTQLDSSTTRKHGGTGLGLAISSRLVEAMGGAISVRSVPGCGSEFSFTIPLVPAGDGPQETAFPGAGRHILVLENNATTAQILSRQLTAWGMSCDIATHDAIAMKLIAKGRKYDAALVDEDMPLVDSMRVARLVRKHGGTRPVPIVLLRTLGRRGASAQAEVAAQVMKPIRPDDLRRTLLAAFANSGAKIPQPRNHVEPESVTPAGEDWSHLKVLVAEDNPVNQKMMTMMLKRFGIKCQLADDGEVAVALASATQFDLILMDMQMPRMDGLQATATIRSATGGEVPKILAVTAGASDEERSQCLAAGMDDYLSKPFAWTELSAAISRIMGTDVRSSTPSR